MIFLLLKDHIFRTYLHLQAVSVMRCGPEKNSLYFIIVQLIFSGLLGSLSSLWVVSKIQMHVLVTSKYKKDRIKNNQDKEATSFSPL